MQMARALGIGGVFFKSANPRRLAAWYARCLGIPLIGPAVATFRPSDMPRRAYTVWSVFPASTRYFRPSESRLMVNFLVDDIEGVLDQVTEAGGKRVGKIRTYPYGRFGWFLDPDGNKVELWQPSPPARKRSRKPPRGSGKK
jgi:predicted enzyme related to lactoylglutathione lyase